jgi:nickel transport system permease protein
MLRFIAGRLALIPLMLLGVSGVVFAMLRLGRGDPALDYLRLSQIPPTDAAIAKARALLGLDRPLVEQYLSWLWDAACPMRRGGRCSTNSSTTCPPRCSSPPSLCW